MLIEEQQLELFSSFFEDELMNTPAAVVNKTGTKTKERQNKIIDELEKPKVISSINPEETQNKSEEHHNLKSAKQEEPLDISIFTDNEEYMRSSTIQKGDWVKVWKCIDNDAANEGYFASFKGKKGIVYDIQEVKNPPNNRYQYNVWVLFNEKSKETGVFYDLELTKLEDRM